MANSLTIERDKKNKTEIKQMTDTHRHTKTDRHKKTCRRKDKQEEKDEAIYYPRTLAHVSKQTNTQTKLKTSEDYIP